MVVPQSEHCTARSAAWATPTAYEKKEVEGTSHLAEQVDPVHDGHRPDHLSGGWHRRGEYKIREGRKVFGTRERAKEKIRVGSWNVGSLTGRSGEVVEALYRRKVDICCLQETRWKGSGTRHLGRSDQMYKLF